MDEKYLSALVLDHAVFDCIEFHREGFQNDNEAKFSLQVQAGTDEGNQCFRVSLVLVGKKEEEYSMKIGLSGFFHVETERLPDNVEVATLIKSNAVAILLPYLRSEVSLLTAQPETECVVMPVFNVNALLDNNE